MPHKIHQVILLISIVGLLVAACGAAPAQAWAGIAVATDNSALYIADNTHLYALSADGKTLLWQQPAASTGGLFGIFGGGSDSGTPSVNVAPVYADPVLAGDVLVVSSYNKSVYGLNAKDGSQKWVFAGSADRLIGSPVVHGDIVYVPSGDSSLYALNLADGTPKGGAWPFKADQELWGTPVVTDDALYVPSMDHTLYAVTPDGNLKWKQTLNGALAGSPAISADGKTLYIGSLNDTLYALNVADGSQLWTAKANGWVWTTPLVADGTLYFGDLSGTVFALDAATGAEKWKATLSSAVRGTPALSNKTNTLLVAVDGGFVYAFDATDGTQKWQHEIDDRNADRLLSNLVVIGDNVIIVPISADQLVYALKVADGSQIWTYKPS